MSCSMPRTSWLAPSRSSTARGSLAPKRRYGSSNERRRLRGAEHGRATLLVLGQVLHRGLATLGLDRRDTRAELVLAHAVGARLQGHVTLRSHLRFALFGGRVLLVVADVT